MKGGKKRDGGREEEGWREGLGEVAHLVASGPFIFGMWWSIRMTSKTVPE